MRGVEHMGGQSPLVGCRVFGHPASPCLPVPGGPSGRRALSLRSGRDVLVVFFHLSCFTPPACCSTAVRRKDFQRKSESGRGPGRYPVLGITRAREDRCPSIREISSATARPRRTPTGRGAPG